LGEGRGETQVIGRLRYTGGSVSIVGTTGKGMKTFPCFTDQYCVSPVNQQGKATEADSTLRPLPGKVIPRGSDAQLIKPGLFSRDKNVRPFRGVNSGAGQMFGREVAHDAYFFPPFSRPS